MSMSPLERSRSERNTFNRAILHAKIDRLIFLLQLLDSNKELSSQLKEADEKSANFETELTNQRDDAERSLQELQEKLKQAELQLKNVRELQWLFKNHADINCSSQV